MDTLHLNLVVFLLTYNSALCIFHPFMHPRVNHYHQSEQRVEVNPVVSSELIGIFRYCLQQSKK